MTYLGLLSQILGLKIAQSQHGIKVHQSKYASYFLIKFNMKYCKPRNTPFLSRVKLEEASSPMVNNTLYTQLIGCLIYLTHTRHDISYAVSVDSIYMDQPHEIHWRTSKRIHMHYIRQLMHDGTIHLIFCASSEQAADIFTKVFCQKTFNNLKSLLGISDHAMKHD